MLSNANVDTVPHLQYAWELLVLVSSSSVCCIATRNELRISKIELPILFCLFILSFGFVFLLSFFLKNFCFHHANSGIKATHLSNYSSPWRQWGRLIPSRWRVEKDGPELLMASDTLSMLYTKYFWQVEAVLPNFVPLVHHTDYIRCLGII